MKKARPILSRSCALIFSTCLIACACFSQDFSRDPHALMPEWYIRKVAIKTALPIYAEEALKQEISAVIQCKIEISGEGEVLRIKLKAHTNDFFKQVVVDAVKQWKFERHYRPDGSGVLMPIISRLTFAFVIRGGKASVELYNPKPDAPESEYLGYYNSAKELREWKDWEEVWTSNNISQQK